MALLKELQRDLGLSGSVDLGLLASYRDIIRTSEQPVDDQRALAAAERVLEKALGALLSMRCDEGRALARDLTARLKDIEHRIATVRQRLPRLCRNMPAVCRHA